MDCMGGYPELTHSEDAGGPQLSPILSKTEATISVSWSGGGQIKPGMYMKSVIIM